MRGRTNVPKLAMAKKRENPIRGMLTRGEAAARLNMTRQGLDNILSAAPNLVRLRKIGSKVYVCEREIERVDWFRNNPPNKTWKELDREFVAERFRRRHGVRSTGRTRRRASWELKWPNKGDLSQLKVSD